MGNAIVDVVLGLVLTYLVLSLLVMKVQEILDGNLLKGRVSNLHEMLLEAVGRSQDLRDRVLKNPLIFALYKGKDANDHMLWRSSGPSSIPPDLFARALLMELNGGRHPSEEFPRPSAFLAARTLGKDVADAPRVWGALNGLLPGNEGDWKAFESAIATWFTDIGDRSDGWFQRRAQWWSFWVALGLAALLNVDSFHIAKTLSRDDTLRKSLADIAQTVDAQQRAAPGTAVATAPAAAEDPAVQAVARLQEAMRRLNSAAGVDPGVRDFNASSAPAGVQRAARDACVFLGAQGKTEPLTIRTWMYWLPGLEARVREAAFDAPDRAAAVYGEAGRCLSHLSAWIGTVTIPGDKGAALAGEAAEALTSAIGALRALIDRHTLNADLRQRFVEDPESFEDCATSASDRAALSSCLLRAQTRVVKLPLLWIATTVSPQFCKAEIVEDQTGTARMAAATRPAAASAPPPPDTSAACQARVTAIPSLGLPAMHLVPRDTSAFSRWLLWLGGVLVTAVFVSLGAPFWFDVLGRVVKVRAAGASRDAAGGAKPSPAKGAPPPAPPAAGTAAPGGPAGPAGPGDGPFASSRNAYEDGLVARDIVALQQTLRVAVATGRLDKPTRQAIVDFCRTNGLEPTEELSSELYRTIVGRPSRQTPAAAPSTRLQLGRVNEQVQPVARQLSAVLDMPGRVPASETRFSADLRALTVLYRFKREIATPIAQREVFALSRTQPGALDEADEALIAEILQLPAAMRFAREAAPWLDWAIGELGQVEVGATSPGNSNPRICEFLETAAKGASAQGDDTPWCGAFVTWVLTKCRAQGLVPQPAAPVANPLLASNWAAYAGTARNPGQAGSAAVTGARPGDVVLFKPLGPGSSGHVGFYISHDATQIQVLGGNQTKRGAVNLTTFNIADVLIVFQP